uniref:Uncharacterized protein n=1 Tax=Vitis vinifera TaxID=29760 RepID=F6H1K2_VITVI
MGVDIVFALLSLNLDNLDCVFFNAKTMVLINLSDSLPILKSIMVKVKEALHSKDNMLPCLGCKGYLFAKRRDQNHCVKEGDAKIMKITSMNSLGS